MVLKRMVSKGCIEKRVKDRPAGGKAASKAGSGKDNPARAAAVLRPCPVVGDPWGAGKSGRPVWLDSKQEETGDGMIPERHMGRGVPKKQGLRVTVGTLSK